VRQLVIKVFDIIDARCNHEFVEVHIFLCGTSLWYKYRRKDGIVSHNNLSTV